MTGQAVPPFQNKLVAKQVVWNLMPVLSMTAVLTQEVSSQPTHTAYLPRMYSDNIYSSFYCPMQ